MPSHHSRRINCLNNGQRTAANLRPGPRFRGRILAVAPMISLAFYYASCAQLELLEGGEYALDQSRFGLPCCGLLNYSFNSFKNHKNWAFFSIKYWTWKIRGKRNKKSHFYYHKAWWGGVKMMQKWTPISLLWGLESWAVDAWASFLSINRVKTFRRDLSCFLRVPYCKKSCIVLRVAMSPSLFVR